MKKRILPMLFAAVLFAVHMSVGVFAAKTGSITVLFRHENIPLTEAEFRIYRVAEWNGSEYSLLGKFGDYPVLLPEDANSDNWQVTASTLAIYAERDKINADADDITNDSGKVQFKGLTKGIYLVIGDPLTVENTLYIPQPMLVTIPYEKKDRTTDYEIVIEPKYDYRELTGETLERRALKIWEDEGNKQSRPDEITVQLLCDGEIYDEQLLSAGNDWRYTWDGLGATHNWQVIEKTVPESYTVKVEQHGVTFTVTNTYDEPDNNLPPPGLQDDSSDDSTLPYTGQFWWPVPILLGGGLLLLTIGIVVLCRKKNKHDE